ncbi:MAG: hypothetical protein H7Y30_14065 [Pyrinomonadaceae bacterium]|nr:hypothetical protein [Pyrinomonadaceae bacterium]
MLNRALTGISLRLLILCVLTLACVSQCPAQQASSSREQPAREDWTARLFDEYRGPLGECDEGARLDNFAIELQNRPTAKGYIIFYDGKWDSPAQIAMPRYERALGYLLNTRSMDGARVMAFKGGFRETQTTELWIAPGGAPAPEPINTITVSLTGRTYKFGVDYFYFPSDEPEIVYEVEDTETEIEEDATVEESSASASVEEQADISGISGDAIQPEETEEVTEEEIEEEESEDDNLSWASESYSKAVKDEPGARACIIYYADDRGTDLDKLKEIVETGKNLLVEKFGLKANSIETIYGGYSSSPTLELWVVPRDASLPTPSPQERPAKVSEEQAGINSENAFKKALWCHVKNGGI